MVSWKVSPAPVLKIGLPAVNDSRTPGRPGAVRSRTDTERRDAPGRSGAVGAWGPAKKRRRTPGTLRSGSTWKARR